MYISKDRDLWCKSERKQTYAVNGKEGRPLIQVEKYDLDASSRKDIPLKKKQKKKNNNNKNKKKKNKKKTERPFR